MTMASEPTALSDVADREWTAGAQGVIHTEPHPNCPFCSAKGENLYSGLVDWLYGVPDTWGIRSCSNCGIAWLDPRPVASDIPRLYAQYCTHDGSRPKTWIGQLQGEVSKSVLARMGYPVRETEGLLPRCLSFLPFAKRRAALAVLNLPASETGCLLDVGCGNGEFIEQMRSYGWSVAGVDLDSSAVEYCRSRGLDVSLGTIADLPETSQYDVIALTHVIEHVADPIELLRECSKRLRLDTGRIVITTPNLKSLGHRWFGKYWRGLEVPRHFVVFSPGGLRQCVEQAGLSVAAMSTETRLAQMIYNNSVCAQAGEREVGQRSQFSIVSKLSARLFRVIEDLFIKMKKDVGEEILCIGTVQIGAPAKKRQGPAVLSCSTRPSIESPSSS
jgi:2-polyprenyl-3-methyl-5-hydroxy-6-metoxy-1,4-benzoquinol methylase